MENMSRNAKQSPKWKIHVIKTYVCISLKTNPFIIIEMTCSFIFNNLVESCPANNILYNLFHIHLFFFIPSDITLNHWFSTRSCFALLGTFDNIWRQF